MTELLSLTPVKYLLLAYFVYMPVPWLFAIGVWYLYDRWYQSKNNT